MARGMDETDPGSAPTLPGSSSDLGAVRVGLPSPSEHELGERYEKRSLLGEGGMGQVHVFRDGVIGREVALKSMRVSRTEQPEALARFLREARVQGQLEHPAIVPVYDLGIGPDGEAYFTMKKIRGRTIEEILVELREGAPDSSQRYSQRKLLSAFSSVCLAIDFAHARGVVHRDLKPQNVMLGDFGEVYVLDWGLAKVAEAADAQSDSIDPMDGESSGTVHGHILGTPGYMAPEQARGAGATADGRADVFALGAILFELLTWQPLVPRGTTVRMLHDTIVGPDARAIARAPERNVPPELEAVCVRACAADPADRFATARELHEAIERFQDGDRDLERRRALASTHAEAAATAAERAFSGTPEALERRKEALREVGRALALDPGHSEARRLLLRLLVEPPTVAPPEARAEIEATEAESRRVGAREGLLGYLLVPAAFPIVAWMGIRNLGLVIATLVLCFVCVALSVVMSRTQRPTERFVFVVFILSSAMVALMAPQFGPFLGMPNALGIVTVVFCAHAKRRGPLLVLASVVLAVAWLLPLTGVLPPSYAFTEEGPLAILPVATSFAPIPTTIHLVVISLATVLIPGFLIGRVHDGLAAAREHVSLQAWQLRQLVS